MQMQYELAPPQMAMSTGNYAQTLYVPNSNRIKSEGTGSDRGASPHISDHSRYSSQTPQNAAPTFQQIAALSNFPSQIPHQQQQNGMSVLQHAYQPTPVQEQYHQQQQQQQQQQQHYQPAGSMGSAPPDEGGRASTGSTGLPKAFACSTCSKGFARRSDLARHERIHSGVRPHVCEHPGCGKQFIQRSALTVHSRVHTGEKPHMCERCGKPFSDSSSLARHRRIHSGKRPYKCPYADCQKTFTRRTTLTRHQNHHTGTIEESEAATAAALASRASVHNQRSRGSDEENDFSGDNKSPMPQQPDRQASASPATGMNGAPMQQRQSSDYYMSAMNAAAMVPAHMRNGLQPSPRPQSPAHTQYPMASNGSQGRPSLTSNPSSGYNPPHILEPPTANGQQQGASGHNSPHMNAALGWQSPHNGIAPPQTTEYTYPADVNNGGYTTAPMYYQQAAVQRPHSTGPLDHYNPMRGQEMWAQQQQ